MSMPLISAFERLAPLLCFGLLGFSILFPSRDIRTVRDLRREFDALRAENAVLRDDFNATLRFLHDYDWGSIGLQRGDAPADTPDGVPSERSRVAIGCSYTRCHGVDGVRRGSDTWLIGDFSPWGVIDSAFRGGFVAEGVLYSFFALNEGLENVQ